MNAIVSNLLAGDKFMIEVYLKQSGFMYSACRSFTKNIERMKQIKGIWHSRYIYQNKLNEAWFQH